MSVRLDVRNDKVPQERFESIWSRRSRGSLMSYTDWSAQRRFKSNTPTF